MTCCKPWKCVSCGIPLRRAQFATAKAFHMTAVALQKPFELFYQVHKQLNPCEV
jgi:hypothetical protein